MIINAASSCWDDVDSDESLRESYERRPVSAVWIDGGSGRGTNT